MKLLAVLLLALAACVPPLTAEQQHDKDHLEIQIWLSERLSYYQDDRTGLCFARYWSQNSNGFSYVPCASIPEQLLRR